MSDIHIEEFYHDIGMILSKLYASFPRKSTIYVADISGEDTPDEYGIHSDRYLSCLSAMVWLQEEGYITFESLIRQEAMDQAVLTEKSFIILNNQANVSLDAELDTSELPPYIAQKVISNINLLRQALKSRSAIDINKIVFHILEQAHQRKV